MPVSKRTMDLTNPWTHTHFNIMPFCSMNSCGVAATPLLASTGALASSSPSLSSVPESSSGEEGSELCDIGLLERLIRTHPIWFLPAVGRAAALHLLQGKEVGTFVVRASSKSNTMALSVRLPEQAGPHVEHYLIESVGEGQLRLEGSDNHFHAIPMLVAHYAHCCDELPVQLTLPTPLSQAASRQELSSLALLGQDFWLSSLVRSPSGSTSCIQAESPTHSTFKPASPDKSPPPPVAPKYQARSAAPPPPPPRTLAVGKAASCANVTSPVQPVSDSSPEPHSPSSNNTADSSQLEDTNHRTEEESESSCKSDPVSPYSHSDILDLTSSVYYKSALDDKISDYEDIWANNNSSSG